MLLEEFVFIEPMLLLAGIQIAGDDRLRVVFTKVLHL
jgi:hypothetical protein